MFHSRLPPLPMRRQAKGMPTVERLDAQKYTDRERERKGNILLIMIKGNYRQQEERFASECDGAHF